MSTFDMRKGPADGRRRSSAENIEVTGALLDEMRAAGVISEETCEEAKSLVIPPRRWGYWAAQVLLSLGAVLTLCGVIFFFAFNWQDMHRFLKLGLIQAVLAVCAVAAVRAGLDRPVGKTLAMAAAVLVGVFLAVFGQIYQTGANAYELFMWWAVFIVPWAVVSRSAPMWALWVALVNVTIFVIGAEGMFLFFLFSNEWLFLTIGIVNLAILFLLEFLYEAGEEWIAPRWFIFTVFAAALSFLTILECMAVFDVSSRYAGLAVASSISWLLALGAGYARYYYTRRDISMLSLGALSLCVVFTTAVGRFVIGSGMEFFGLLFMAVFVLGIFTAAGWWLHETHKKFREGGAGSSG